MVPLGECVHAWNPGLTLTPSNVGAMLHEQMQERQESSFIFVSLKPAWTARDLVSNSNSSYLLLLLLIMRLIKSCHTSHTSQTSYVYVECNMHTCSYTVRPRKCMLSVNVHTCSHTVRPRKCMLSVTKDNLQWWHLWSVKAETNCFLSISAVLWGVGDYI